LVALLLLERGFRKSGID